MNEAQNLMSSIYNGTAFKSQEDNRQKWEELEALYQACMESLVLANNSIYELYGIEGILNFIQNENEVKVALNGLAGDIESFSARLKAIHERHVGKTGPVENETDLSMCFTIFEEYYAYQSHYTSVIVPTVMFLTDAISLAAEKMKQHYQENPPVLTDEQNPNVVTDVEIKETAVVIEESTNV